MDPYEKMLEPLELTLDSSLDYSLRCRALLLSVIRRAVFDWVIYRQSRSLPKRKLAAQAYIWLYVEAPGHWHANLRQKEGRGLLSFLSLCEQLDLQPEKMRSAARAMTMEQILRMGRPPTRRKMPRESSSC